MATIKEEFRNLICKKCINGKHHACSNETSGNIFESIEKFWLEKLKEREIAEYRQGYNDCLKDQKLTGEEHQRLYL